MARRVRVLIRPKTGVLDPQGDIIERSLPALGFEGASNVRVGKLIELDVDNLDQLEEMCDQLLANTLIEDYEIDLGSDRTQKPQPGTKAPA